MYLRHGMLGDYYGEAILGVFCTITRMEVGLQYAAPGASCQASREYFMRQKCSLGSVSIYGALPFDVGRFGWPIVLHYMLAGLISVSSLQA